MMHTIMHIEWSTSFPHNDTDGHLSKAGRVSTANFAKGQAELALRGLDAKED